tara:strand:- start:98 stop:688 length:591 start_codon:yes stop_codon:yes gene_type:complete
MKNTKLAIRIIGFFILVLIVLFIFFTLENVLEESAYELTNKNLWLGVPLVIIGYLIFETIQSRFGKQLLESDFLKNKMMEGQKETKESASWFVFDYLNGKCPYCENTFLSTYVSEEHALSDKILKCSKCKSLCRKTFPDKWIFSPSYIAGGIVFLSELAGEYETELMVGSVLLSLVFSLILSRFWINEKSIKINLE